MIESLFYKGYRIIQTNSITKRTQRRTHKKRRIKKKWLKRYGYKTVLDDNKIFMYKDTLFVTPKTYKKIFEQMKGGAADA